MSQPVGVHFVGSIPFKTSKEVFSKICKSLPQRFKAIPDGETGVRDYFVAWQKSVFPVEVLAASVRDFASPADQEFECRLEHIKPTQYDAAAASSYQQFCQSREEGVIPHGVRFQVSLPGTISAVYPNVDPRYKEKVLSLYEQRYLEDVGRLQESIPASDLAVQLDLAVEMGLLERSMGRSPQPSAMFEPRGSDKESVLQNILDRVLVLVKSIKPEIPLGFHLCYGDIGHQHFIQPQDLDLLVEVSNELVNVLKPYHSVSWIHMPCPKERTDVAYYEPLKKLSIESGTKLFLGLVHARDEEGTRKRIAAAQKVYQSSFGVATECGMGRTASEDVDSIFDICTLVTAPVIQ